MRLVMHDAEGYHTVEVTAEDYSRILKQRDELREALAKLVDTILTGGPNGPAFAKARDILERCKD